MSADPVNQSDLHSNFIFITNPVRKGLVSDPVDWKYSSAIDYFTDEKGLIELNDVLIT